MITRQKESRFTSEAPMRSAAQYRKVYLFLVVLLALVGITARDVPTGSPGTTAAESAPVAGLESGPALLGAEEKRNADQALAAAQTTLAAEPAPNAAESTRRRADVRKVGAGVLNAAHQAGASRAQSTQLMEGLSDAILDARIAAESAKPADARVKTRRVIGWLDQAIEAARLDEQKLEAIAAADPASEAVKSKRLNKLAEHRKSLESKTAALAERVRGDSIDTQSLLSDLTSIVTVGKDRAHGIQAANTPPDLPSGDVINNAGSADSPVFSGITPPLPPSNTTINGVYQPSLPPPAVTDCTINPAAPDCSFPVGFEYSPVLSAKVAELGGDAYSIYSFVRNRVEFEPYVGVNKGPEATLRTGKGGVQEHCALLATMLRGAGYPTQYAFGWVYMPIEQAQRWLGQPTLQATATLAQFRFPYQARFDELNNLVGYYLYLSWVEAYVPYGARRGDLSEKRWVPLMPYISDQALSAGVPGAHAATAFNEQNFLSTVRKETADEYYERALHDVASGLGAGYGSKDIPMTRATVPELIGVLPSTLPVEIVIPSNISRLSEMPSNYILKANVVVYGNDGLFSYFSLGQVLSMPYHGLRRLTLSWAPETAFDQAVINAYGGLANTPFYSVYLTPELRSEGTLLAAGTSVLYGDQFNIQLYFQQFESPSNPNGTGFFSTKDKWRLSGTMYAIGFDGMQFSDDYLAEREDKLLQVAETYAGAFPQDNVESLTGEIIYAAGVKYLLDNEKAVQKAAGLYHFQHLRSPQHQTTEASVDAVYLFDRPYMVVPIGAVLDAWALSSSEHSLLSNSSKLSELQRVQAYASSALEHQLWEHFLYIESVSTTKLLQRANSIGMPVYDFPAGTPAATITSSLSLNSFVENAIVNASANGARVVVHKSNQTINQWVGAGWFEQYANGFGMLISGGLFAGQDTSGSSSGSAVGLMDATLAQKLGLLAPGSTGPANNGGAGSESPPKFIYDSNGNVIVIVGGSPNNVGDPVNLASGNLYYPARDVSIPSVAFPLDFGRMYNSLIPYDGPMGQKWVHSYDSKVAPTGNPGELAYLSEVGGTHVYTETPPGSGVYLPPPGFFSTISQVGSTYVHRLKDGTKRVYNAADGRLLYVEYRTGVKRNLTYNGAGQLVTISDDFGAQITLAYDVSGRISSLTDHVGRTWNYVHNAAGDLVSMTTPSDGSTPPSTVTYAYDSNHRMTSVTSPNGGTLQIQYYADNKVHRQLFPDGRTFTFVYDAVYQEETAVIEPNGSVAYFSFDDKGDLVQKVLADGSIWTFERDQDRNITEMVDAVGGVVTMTYDALGNMLTATSAVGNTTTYVYEPTFSRIQSVSDNLGTLATMLYDGQGNMTSTANASGAVTSIVYNGVGQPLSATDPLGYSIFMTYDASGRLTSQTDKNGNVWTFEYDSLNRRTKQTLSDGTALTVAFDPLDRAKSINENGAVVYEYAYDLNGNLVEETNAGGNTVSFTYDAADSPIAIVYQNGASRDLHYDENKFLTGWQDPDGTDVAREYDVLGRIVATTDSAGARTQYERDARGLITKITDALGRSVTYQYDLDWRPTKKVYPDGSYEQYARDARGRVTQYRDRGAGITGLGYDARDNLTTVTNALGQVRTLAYNVRNETSQIVDALGNTSTMAFDPNGNLLTRTDGNGRTSTWTYNSLNQRTQRVIEDGQGTVLDTLTSTRDWTGRVLGAADSDTSVTFNVDALRRYTGVTTAGTAVQPPTTIGLTYDASNQIASIIAPSGSGPAYTYNAKSQIASVLDPVAGQIGLVNDVRGYVIGHSYPNGAVVGMPRDTDGQQSAAFHKRATVDLGSVQYKYNDLGNIVARIADGGQSSYTYSAARRITSAAHPGGAVENWTYDALGNWTSSSTSATYVRNAGNQLVSDDTYTYEYDGEGNRTKRVEKVNAGNFTTYAYDYDNRLTGISTYQNSVLGSSASYAYDALGQRVQKVENGNTRRYVYAAGHIVAEYDGANQLVARYVYGPGLDRPLAMVKGGQVYYYHQDLNGSVLALSNAAGSIVQKYKYDTFGNRTFVQDPAFEQPFGFTGREHDLTGLIHLRNRAYDPGIGQFIQQDPSGYNGGLNLYAYCDNNPLLYIDPMGLGWLDWVQTGLDVIGLIPVVGEVADGVNGLISLGRGNYVDAGLSFASMIPIGGQAATAAKWGKHGVDALNAAGDVGRHADDIVVIGRQWDTAVAKDWPGHTVLDLPSGWTLGKNDAFIKDAIDNGKSVYVGSPQTFDNLWDTVNNRERVFNRELRQLEEAGYRYDGDYLIPPGHPRYNDAIPPSARPRPKDSNPNKW
ncbi:MAG: hypothetical protein IPK82_40960 [Polyangiaceae bacterium]|nr:hypothetical protein [Polyangiaceae bacterium]